MLELVQEEHGDYVDTKECVKRMCNDFLCADKLTTISGPNTLSGADALGNTVESTEKSDLKTVNDTREN